MMSGAVSKVVSLVRALVLLGVIAVGIPVVLVAAARARFGGAAPFHGVPSPTDWDPGEVWSALTDRLSDDTIADVVIRLALVVAWVAVAVLVLTVVGEVVHMVRYRGVPMPDIRGLGLTQSVARVIAVGLLVVVPMVSSPQRAIARDGGAALLQAPGAAVAAVEGLVPGVGSDASAASSVRPDNVWPDKSQADARTDGPAAADAVAAPAVVPPVFGGESFAEPEQVAPAAEPGEYVVRAGDSIYGIAERLAGPDRVAVADFASELLDLNLGNEMVDGLRFTNAAFIDVGWVLQLPASSTATTTGDDGVHTVEQGESLWSIADDQLGDPERWPEIYDANAGTTFDDGRTLDDPDLIQPGWELEMPGDDDVVEPADEPAVEPVARALPPPVAADVVSVEQVADDDEPARPVNVWPGREQSDAISVVAASVGADAPGDRPDDELAADDLDDEQAAGLLTVGSAAMLSAGVLTLLAIRRRQRLRSARPRARLVAPSALAASTERSLRATDAGDRHDRVVLAVRMAALQLVGADERVEAVVVAGDGTVELYASGPAALDVPWEPGPSAAVWRLPASLPHELLAEQAGGVPMPSPTLVQVGRTADHRDVYVDLEAIEAIEVGGPGEEAEAIVTAMAATLAGSVLAEVVTLVGVGVPDEAFLGHRLHRAVRDSQRAFEAAADAIGSTAAQPRSTFELRAAAVSGEAWEPAVVLAGAAAGTIAIPPSRTGLAVVSASPIHGPSSRLAPDGDLWALQPLGLRFRPVGLSPAEVAAIAELVTVPAAAIVSDPVDPEPVVDAPTVDEVVDVDATIDPRSVEAAIDGSLDTATAPPEPEPSWSLLVRLLGRVDVVSAEGESVSFERSKTRELVAWLSTHRERSTRSAARTALWEQDVRDATFSNVVSEARRALARLVDPPDGDEWVGRTLTDALPLHELVRTDAQLVAHALEVARLQPPDQAIATLTPAVGWITGMPFEGTSYLWPDAEGLTSELVLLATSAATELAAHCLSVGDIDGVFRATARGLQVLQGHEELIGLRMQAHARFGDHAGVRQEWESYERVINADPWSDGEPSPKLVELRRELLNPSRST